MPFTRQPGLALAVAMLLAAAFPGQAAEAGTEAETQRAICEAVGSHWKQQDTKYVLSALVVQDDWAIFDGIPATVANASDEEAKVRAGRKLKSGTDYIAAVLNKKKGKWVVVESWPHGDIPEPSEFKNKKTTGLPDGLITSFFKALQKG